MTKSQIANMRSDEEDFVMARFSKYKHLALNLTERYTIKCDYDIISLTFSNDTTRICAVLKESDERFYVI